MFSLFADEATPGLKDRVFEWFIKDPASAATVLGIGAIVVISLVTHQIRKLMAAALDKPTIAAGLAAVGGIGVLCYKHNSSMPFVLCASVASTVIGFNRYMHLTPTEKKEKGTPSLMIGWAGLVMGSITLVSQASYFDKEVQARKAIDKENRSNVVYVETVQPQTTAAK
jgi:presenilin-like A22 family membrane protease